MTTLSKHEDPFHPSVISVIRALGQRVHLLILPWLLVGYVEYLNRSSVHLTLKWGWEHPKPLFFNYLIVLALLFVFAALIGRTWMAYVMLALLFSIAGFISGIKLKLLGIPLLPWDVVLSKETEDIAAYLSGVFNWKMIVVVSLFIVCSFVLFKYIPFFNKTFRWTERGALLTLGALLAYSAYHGQPIRLQDTLELLNYTWNQTQNYEVNGFMAGTTMNIDAVFIPKPKQYSKETIDKIVQNIPRRTNIDPALKPNVIVILSESFWDATQLPKVQFDKDPVPFFHSLQQTFSNGYMLSPQYGGGTANVEFEVLSGNSMRFMPQGSTPYIQYVHHGVDSLASILTRQGYTSTAINPYHDWFFNSRNVYKDFGFAKFVSMEFFEQNVKGLFIADTEVTKNIIRTTESTAGPDFVFANTLENHLPYDVDKFPNNPIKVSGDISEYTKTTLESYATGISDADQMLKALVEHFAAAEEPTIIAFFGDHKPVLGANYAIYKEGGLLSEDDPDFFRKVFSVPVVVWNNYLPAHKDNLDISPSFLGPYLLNLAELEGTPYTDYLHELSKRYPMLPTANYYDKYGIRAEDLEPYRLMQYDMLFGEQYGLQAYSDKIINPDYYLGHGKTVITSVAPNQLTAGQPAGEDDGRSTISVAGQFFCPQSVVYVNNKSVPTKVNSDGTLTATVQPSLYKKPGKLPVQVRVYDSHDIVVSRSNIVEVAVNQ